MDDLTQLVLLAAIAPFALATGLWLWRRPIRVLGAYLAVLPFGSSVALPLGVPRSFSTVSSLLGIATGMAYLWHWYRHRPTLRIPSASLPIWILYSGLAVASVAWSIRPAVTVSNLLVLASLVGLFVVVVVTPSTSDDLRQLRTWIAGGGAATGFYGLALAVSGNLQTTGAGVERFEITGAGGGEGGDPNITAAALVVPIALALWEFTNRDEPNRRRFLFLGAAGVAGSAVLLTASRGGLLAVGLMGMYIVVASRRGVWSMVLLGLLVLPTVLLVPSTFEERADNTGSSGRTEIWRLAIESCPQYCPIGSGFGTFADVHETAFLVSEANTGTQLRYQAHSIWFESLIEVGVTGFLLLAVGLVVTLRDVLRVPFSRRGGAFAGVMGLLVTNTFLSNFTFKYFWLGLIYAMLVVGASKNDRISATTPPGVRSLPGPDQSSLAPN